MVMLFLVKGLRRKECKLVFSYEVYFCVQNEPSFYLRMGNENIYMFTRNDDYELRVELDDFDGNRR